MQIRTEASITLNFLIYIQNAYLNQTAAVEEYRFPYIPSIQINFQEDFPSLFNAAWNKAAHQIAEDAANDRPFYHSRMNSVFGAFVEDSGSTLHLFKEVEHSFRAWWNSIAGRFAIERSIDTKLEKVYRDLASNPNLEGKHLEISLIYDDCRLGRFPETNSFAIVSVKEFFIAHNDFVQKVKQKF